jgi:hypothetical protein
MYAMIRRYRMAAGSIDDLMHKVDTQYADRVPEEVGAVLYTAIDTGDGHAVRGRGGGPTLRGRGGASTRGSGRVPGRGDRGPRRRGNGE